MKYHVEIDGDEVEIELVERGGKTYARHEELPDGEIEVELAPVRNGSSFSLLVGSDQVPVVTAGPNDDLTLVLGSETWHCTVMDSREALARAVEGAGGGRAGGGVLRSVMPGIVRDLKVEVGAEVQRGDPLLILEAMKMENEIRADADGVVAEIHAAPGTAVAKGDPLVTLG